MSPDKSENNSLTGSSSRSRPSCGHPPSMRRIIGSIAVLLLLTVVFLYHTKFPVLQYGCPAFSTNLEEKWSTTDIEEKWSTGGYRRYTSSMYLKHGNSTRTLRGQSSTPPWVTGW